MSAFAGVTGSPGRGPACSRAACGRPAQRLWDARMPPDRSVAARAGSSNTHPQAAVAAAGRGGGNPAPAPWQQSSRRCRRRCRDASRVVCSASERQQRDPAAWGSMDRLREELERGGISTGGGFVTGLINWLGEAANAKHTTASPLQAAYKWLLRGGPLPGSADSGGSYDELDGSDLDQAALEQLQTLLLCSRAAAIRLVRRCPLMLEMDRTDLMARLVGMKELFPGSDVARMVELAPAAFLEGAWAPKAQHLHASSVLLRRELEGAEVDFMFQEDPFILFEPVESLDVGLRRLRELWPNLSPQALADSEPLHLSLAVKALGLTGPPKGF